MNSVWVPGGWSTGRNPGAHWEPIEFKRSKDDA